MTTAMTERVRARTTAAVGNEDEKPENEVICIEIPIYQYRASLGNRTSGIRGVARGCWVSGPVVRTRSYHLALVVPYDAEYSDRPHGPVSRRAGI
jgi:hypothetical protein